MSIRNRYWQLRSSRRLRRLRLLLRETMRWIAIHDIGKAVPPPTACSGSALNKIPTAQLAHVDPIANLYCAAAAT